MAETTVIGWTGTFGEGCLRHITCLTELWQGMIRAQPPTFGFTMALAGRWPTHHIPANIFEGPVIVLTAASTVLLLV